VKTLAVVAALVPLSVLPNLVTAENQIEFHVLAALAPLMLLYLVAAVRELVRAFSGRHAPAWAPAFAVWATVAVATVMAWSNTHAVFIDPSVKEGRLFRHALAPVDPATTREVRVVIPRAGRRVRKRLGIFSTTSDITQAWVPRPLVALVLAERGIRWPESRVRIVKEPGPPRRDVVSVDTTPLQSAPR
jgi:hypothetical protein